MGLEPIVPEFRSKLDYEVVLTVMVSLSVRVNKPLEGFRSLTIPKSNLPGDLISVPIRQMQRIFILREIFLFRIRTRSVRTFPYKYLNTSLFCDN